MAKRKGKALVVGAALVVAGGAAVKAPEIGRALSEVGRAVAEAVRYLESWFGPSRIPTPEGRKVGPDPFAGGEEVTPEMRLFRLEEDLRSLVPGARFTWLGARELRIETGNADGGIDLFGRWIERRRGDAGSGGTVEPQDRRPLECSLDLCAQDEDKWSISGACRDATLGASEEGLELSFSVHGRTISYAFTATEVQFGYEPVDLPGGVALQRTPTGYEAVVCPVTTIRSARDFATFRGGR